jgi:hypothetical protein
MGVESTAILVRWLKEPASRPCPLDKLIVLTAMTGDEYLDTIRNMEQYILPMLREYGVRFVQVARHGHLEADGITILSDTTQPDRLFAAGDYKLSDELREAGSLPQFAGGTHICSLKFKAFVLETWLRGFEKTCNLVGQSPAISHAFGYNVDEPKRIAKCIAADRNRLAFGFNVDESKRVVRARQYDTPTKVSIFPLVEWGWTRQDCIDYLQHQLGVTWSRSCCYYCPFNSLKKEAIERHMAHPEQVAEGLMLEHVSMTLNPRGQLYRDKSLVQITQASGNQTAINLFRQKLEASRFALYRVRRIYNAKRGEDGRELEGEKGQAIRAVEKLELFSDADEAETALTRLAERMGLQPETKGFITYVYVQRRVEGTYPTREEYFTAGPALVPTKTRYGLPHFNEQWCASQGTLFPIAA